MITHSFPPPKNLSEPRLISACTIGRRCRAARSSASALGALLLCSTFFLPARAQRAGSQTTAPLNAASLPSAAHDSISAKTAAEINVTTYHNNTMRNGWDNAEKSLTPSVVGGASFGLLHQVKLDDQVDGQPLLVTGLTIAGGTHDVVYVATEGNTVYAIDAASGTILQQTNLGTPVSIHQLPGGCNNNGNNVGVNSTPVIDLSSQTLYVMAYVYTGSVQQFVLHALSLTTLADKLTPVVVTAAHTLSDGTTLYSFTAAASRQRAALLEANGNIYAGFASFCDINANLSRGWLLGWTASTLAPLAQTQLNNRVLPGNSPSDFFLSSIWMSGYGPAAGPAGNLFFVTGNSDPRGTTYDKVGTVNLSESVIEMPPTLSHVLSYFSPTDSGADVATLDEQDEDFGSGGVMLLPNQPGATSPLAVAAGKAGIMYLLKRGNLGGENSGNALSEVSIGGCWCGPSYFKGPDGIGRVVSSGGNNVNVWEVQTSPSTTLVADPGFTSPSVNGSQDPGFFTSISSNGTAAGSAIIWAVGRPFDSSNDVTLYAFDAASGKQLYADTAGTWPNTGGNSNLVPTVANGRVYVASYQMLSIFGIEVAGEALVPKSKFVRPAPPSEAVLSAHQISGYVREVVGARVVIELRNGQRVTADLTEAARRHATIQPQVGNPVLARGDYDRNGILQAESIMHAKAQPVLWRPDR